ncbi:hypothetical protein ACN20G_21135 [Streptomyces sp. BI20]|uniref:hypothetical protein n=1 Tax=Streptomyces sp. BI20 TaxID=3403460 RepID=UPI003C784AF9
MTQREAALRLDETWAELRADREERPPGAPDPGADEAEALLTRLVHALREAARDGDVECTARLGLRLADLAGLRFGRGDRAGALSAVGEALHHSEQAARRAPDVPEFTRWWARGLINQGVWLAWPLSDDRRLPRWPLGSAGSEGPGMMERAAGERALALTRTAVDVWAGLDRADAVNRRGLAQAKVFLADRLAELGHREEAVAWAVDAENDFRRLLAGHPGGASAAEAAGEAEGVRAALAHLARQLDLRLRHLEFASLVRLRAQGLLPERLLGQAVVLGGVRGLGPDEIAEGLGVPPAQVAAWWRGSPWPAVWRVDVRDRDGLWSALPRPWQGRAEVRGRTAADVSAELAESFLGSSERPAAGTPWRLHVWWRTAGDPAAALYRLAGTVGTHEAHTP